MISDWSKADTRAPALDDEPKVAIFLDAENLVGFIRKGGAASLVEAAAEFGPVVVRRAFARFGQAFGGAGEEARVQGELSKAGFELVHTFWPVSGKNSADVLMAVDAMDYLARVPDLGWFVLATGDSDFSPLFRRLRERGKRVVGAGPRSVLAEFVASSCTRFLYLDRDAGQLCTTSPALAPVAGPAGGGTVERRSPGPDVSARRGQASNQGTEATHGASARADAFDLLDRCLRASGGTLDLAGLKSRMQRISPAFDERTLGFRDFRDFVQASRFAEVTRDESVWTASLVGMVAGQPSGSGPAAEQSYERRLRRCGWRVVDRDVVADVIEALRDVEGPMPALKNAALEALASRHTDTEIRKAFAVVFRSGLLELTGASDSIGQFSRLRGDLDDDGFADMIDTALVARLLGSDARVEGELDPAELAPLLFGAAEDVRLARVKELARRSCDARDIESLLAAEFDDEGL